MYLSYNFNDILVHDLWVALTARMGQMNLLFYNLQEIEEVEVIHLLQSMVYDSLGHEHSNHNGCM